MGGSHRGCMATLDEILPLFRNSNTQSAEVLSKKSSFIRLSPEPTNKNSVNFVNPAETTTNASTCFVSSATSTSQAKPSDSPTPIEPLSHRQEPPENRSLTYLKEQLDKREITHLTDSEILELIDHSLMPQYCLEALLKPDYERAVSIRRRHFVQRARSCGQHSSSGLDLLPYKNFDYSRVDGVCCENVIGYVPLPVGVVGPLLLDSAQYFVPMATTEGCLVASANRGCRAIEMSGGVRSFVYKDGMARAPVVRFSSAGRSLELAEWVKSPINRDKISAVFEKGSRFLKLNEIQTWPAGRILYIRFVAKTGDAMGMNMVSSATDRVLRMLKEESLFPDMEVVSLSGNLCVDKKASAMNWIEGRGKSVICEAVIRKEAVERILKTSVQSLVRINNDKNLVGSAVAGACGGFNAHAGNLVAAIFIACGQDPAQVTTSSQCITQIEFEPAQRVSPTSPSIDTNEGSRSGQSPDLAADSSESSESPDLYMSCTMPSLEVGTVGGGTALPAQRAALSLLGLTEPPSPLPTATAEEAGGCADRFARIVCATVLAGELSLLSALSAGHLVEAHDALNRRTRRYSHREPAESNAPATAPPGSTAEAAK